MFQVFSSNFQTNALLSFTPLTEASAAGPSTRNRSSKVINSTMFIRDTTVPGTIPRLKYNINFFHCWLITIDKSKCQESSRLIFGNDSSGSVLTVPNPPPKIHSLKSVMSWPFGLGSAVGVIPVNAKGHLTQKIENDKIKSSLHSIWPNFLIIVSY